MAVYTIGPTFCGVSLDASEPKKPVPAVGMRVRSVAHPEWGPATITHYDPSAGTRGVFRLHWDDRPSGTETGYLCCSEFGIHIMPIDEPARKTCARVACGKPAEDGSRFCSDSCFIKENW